MSAKPRITLTILFSSRTQEAVLTPVSGGRVMDSLGREMCEFCRATGMLTELRALVTTIEAPATHAPASLLTSDAVRLSFVRPLTRQCSS